MRQLLAIIACSLLGLGLTCNPTSHKVTLDWTLPPGSYSGFNIYKQSGDGFSLLAKVGVQTEYVDSSVIAGATYSYYVTTTYDGIESKPSVTAITTVP